MMSSSLGSEMVVPATLLDLAGKQVRNRFKPDGTLMVDGLADWLGAEEEARAGGRRGHGGGSIWWWCRWAPQSRGWRRDPLCRGNGERFLVNGEKEEGL
jgi:hypothetical protein